ncbi:hypothetical protein JCM3770_006085, partial [Rhodotorula araucariae]
MSEHGGLPPLPPPLPPTHSRSVSSSSSSNTGGSPQPSASEWGALPSLARRDSAASNHSASTSASDNRRRRNAARGKDSDEWSGSLDHLHRSQLKRGRPPALARTLSTTSSSSSTGGEMHPPHARSALSAAAISAADLDFPRSPSATATSATRLPSPSASSFNPHPHHTTASIGLGGSPSFPAPSALFARPHTSHAQVRDHAPPQTQLPSPPRTASDSGTLRVAAPSAHDAKLEINPLGRRLRARPSSIGDSLDLDGADELEEGTESAERRRERRARMAEDVREKNQRILDSINGVGVAASPGKLRRSSTNSTIRDFAAEGDDRGSLADEPAPGSIRSPSSKSASRHSLAARPRDLDMIFLADGDEPRAVPRSRTLGDLDRAARARSYHPHTPSSALASTGPRGGREPASAPPAERARTALGYASPASGPASGRA